MQKIFTLARKSIHKVDQWSSGHLHPDSRASTHTPIPVEILNLILQYVHSLHDLITLMHCSRALRFLSETYVYASIDLTKCPVRTILLSHTLEDRPDLAISIHTLHLPIFSHPISTNTASPKNARRHEKLRIQLGAAQIAILNRTANLRTLQISLTVHADKHQDRAERIDSLVPVLVRLPLERLAFTGRTSDSGGILDIIRDLHVPRRLTHLQVPIEPDYFPSPTISLPSSKQTPTSLRLHTFSGPASFFTSLPLSPNTPLRETSFGLLTKWNFRSTLAVLASHRDNLRSLELAVWHVPDCMAEIAHLFGDVLVHLKIGAIFLPEQSEMFERFIEEMPDHLKQMHRLQNLDLSGSHVWITTFTPPFTTQVPPLFFPEKPRCMEWSSACPTLNNITFPSGAHYYAMDEAWDALVDEDDSTTQVGDDVLTPFSSDLHRKRSKVL